MSPHMDCHLLIWPSTYSTPLDHWFERSTKWPPASLTVTIHLKLKRIKWDYAMRLCMRLCYEIMSWDYIMRLCYEIVHETVLWDFMRLCIQSNNVDSNQFILYCDTVPFTPKVYIFCAWPFELRTSAHLSAPVTNHTWLFWRQACPYF